MNSEWKDFQSASGTTEGMDVRENCKGNEPNQPVSDETGFIDEKRLLAKLPISRRTLGSWKAKGILPYIKIGRRCLYDWPSIQCALLRRQRGGQQ
jgi:hypothetical protein